MMIIHASADRGPWTWKLKLFTLVYYQCIDTNYLRFYPHVKNCGASNIIFLQILQYL